METPNAPPQPSTNESATPQQKQDQSGETQETDAAAAIAAIFDAARSTQQQPTPAPALSLDNLPKLSDEQSAFLQQMGAQIPEDSPFVQAMMSGDPAKVAHVMTAFQNTVIQNATALALRMGQQNTMNSILPKVVEAMQTIAHHTEVRNSFNTAHPVLIVTGKQYFG